MSKVSATPRSPNVRAVSLQSNYLKILFHEKIYPFYHLRFIVLN